MTNESHCEIDCHLLVQNDLTELIAGKLLEMTGRHDTL